MSTSCLHIIGGGLAGCEAAWAASEAGLAVTLYEMRPKTMTPAHKTGLLAELVCSNSLRSDDAEANAVGVLHQEMRLAGSLVMQAADRHKLPAGSALAVDREGFSQAITEAITQHPLITVCHEEVTSLPPEAGKSVIIAAGPLASQALSENILALTGQESLAFFDALAPIVYKESVDFSLAWMQSRYDKGEGADYINCPLNKEQYEAFIDALLDGKTMPFKDWEKDTPYFEGCLPVEVMAGRGRETLRYGPLKPVGLTNPHNPQERPYAVVQLRQDNALGALYNMVGFQTKMKHGYQKDVFRLIPGLQNARFARLGGVHRNTFLDSPRLLDDRLCLKKHPEFRFAGQITGVEGYVESAALGILAGRFAVQDILGLSPSPPPPTTAMGALLAHVSGRHGVEDTAQDKKTFQPMNINFGLFPPLSGPEQDGPRLKRMERKKRRKQDLAHRALRDFQIWTTHWNTTQTGQAC